LKKTNLVNLLNYSLINNTTINIFLNLYPRSLKKKLYPRQMNTENKIHMKYVLSTISTSTRTIISVNETLFCIQPPIYKKIEKVRKVNLYKLYLYQL